MNTIDILTWHSMSIIGITIMFLSNRMLWKHFWLMEIDMIIVLSFTMLMGGPFMFIGGLLYALERKINKK